MQTTRLGSFGKTLRLGLLALALSSLAACSSVTITPEPTAKLTSKPTFEQRKNYFFWGLSGEHRINVSQVCGELKPVQMQSQQTFVDGLFGALTLGIYAPHTARVWCQ